VSMNVREPLETFNQAHGLLRFEALIPGRQIALFIGPHTFLERYKRHGKRTTELLFLISGFVIKGMPISLSIK